MSVRRALALVAALPLLLAGCSDDPEPKMPDPTPSSSSSTPTAEPTKEQESPEDFIRRWVEVGDRMQVTGETSEYEALTYRTCKACREFVSTVREVYAQGGSIEFDGAEIDRISRREEQPPTFAVTKTLPKTVIMRKAGAPAETLPAGTTTLLVILQERRDQWTVKYYGVL